MDSKRELIQNAVLLQITVLLLSKFPLEHYKRFRN